MEKSRVHYKTPKDQIQKDWDVIVIGSGIGGMSAANALSKSGKRVLILEQHYIPGGFTHTFSRKGYTWDVGVHCVGDVGEKGRLGRIFNWLTDNQLKWESLGDIYETMRFPDNFAIQFPSTKDGYRDSLYQKFPNEKEVIDRYFDLTKKVSSQFFTYYPTRTFPLWLEKFLTETVGLAGKTWRNKTTEEVLIELGASEKLRTVLTAQWGYYGDLPSQSAFVIHALVMRHFLWGAYFPVGNASSIAHSFLSVLQKNKGEILLRATVNGLLWEGEKVVGVRLVDGTEFKAKHVISTIGAHNTVKHLLPNEKQTSPWAKEILGINHSPGHVALYIGLEGDIEKHGATRSSQWVFNTWERKTKFWNYEKEEAPIIFVSFPSIKDPEHKKNHGSQFHTAEVVTFVAWDEFKKWEDSKLGKRPEDYKQLKESLENSLLEQFKKSFPDLAPLIRHHEFSTPLSTVYFDRSVEGAIYGLEHTPKRFNSHALRTRTPYKGLLMGGQDVASCGIAGGLVGGMLAAATVDSKIFLKMK